MLDQLDMYQNNYCIGHIDIGVSIMADEHDYEITFSYGYIRKNVFDEIVNKIIKLIGRQIKKANGDIARTYLIGGFGGSPYLRKRIINEFPINSPYSIGNLIQDERGDTAAMRGALFYGIDNSRKDLQSNVVEEEYGDENTSQFNTLVCLGNISTKLLGMKKWLISVILFTDIGYNTTACSYRNLANSDKKMTDIINW